VWNDKNRIEIPVNAQSDITVMAEEADVVTNGIVLDDDHFTGALRVEGGEPVDAHLVYNHSTVDAPLFLEDGRAWSGEIPVDGGVMDFDAIPPLQLSGDMALNGSPLTAWGFQRGLEPLVGKWGYLIVTIGVVLFGISTAISWSYYGDRAVVYLFGPRWVVPYKVVFCVMNFLGAIFSLEIVWNFGDSALGLMSLPNLIALVLLNRQVRKMTGEYFSRTHEPVR
jgi:AGCS family alanine or glycine:cation symporter